MQRIGTCLVVASLLASRPALAQDAAGTALWRLIGTTLAVPPALAAGPAAAFWNPAQTEDSARTQVALEGIQTPDQISASGMLAAFRVRARPLGYVGVVYGRVGMSDIARTTDSPDPIGSSVPVFTQTIGLNWARVLGRTGVGATLAYHQTRIDATDATRVTLDVGASRELLPQLRVAAATHFFSSLSARDPAQDIYAGVELRLWHGNMWGGGGEGGTPGALHGRYGIAFAHGFTADHQVGLGLEIGKAVAFDAAMVSEGSYGESGWRPVGSVRVAVGKYRITMARDGGMADLGSAYRVGVDARFP